MFSSDRKLSDGLVSVTAPPNDWIPRQDLDDLHYGTQLMPSIGFLSKKIGDIGRFVYKIKLFVVI